LVSSPKTRVSYNGYTTMFAFHIKYLALKWALVKLYNTIGMVRCTWGQGFQAYPPKDQEIPIQPQDTHTNLHQVICRLLSILFYLVLDLQMQWSTLILNINNLSPSALSCFAIWSIKSIPPRTRNFWSFTWSH